MFGIDEAGRGPVLGSMFVAYVRCPNIDILPDGIKDSKKLSTSEIHDINTQIQEKGKITVIVREIMPSQIDSCSSLSSLTIEAMADMIEEDSATESQGLIDACYSDESKFREELNSKLDNGYNITAENGADEKYGIVGAASIVAKSEREKHVEKIQESFDVNVGSGYPSDPKTRNFLRKQYKQNKKWPKQVRESWNTCSKIKKNIEQSSIGEY